MMDLWKDCAPPAKFTGSRFAKRASEAALRGEGAIRAAAKPTRGEPGNLHFVYESDRRAANAVLVGLRESSEGILPPVHPSRVDEKVPPGAGRRRNAELLMEEHSDFRMGRKNLLVHALQKEVEDHQREEKKKRRAHKKRQRRMEEVEEDTGAELNLSIPVSPRNLVTDVTLD